MQLRLENLNYCLEKKIPIVIFCILEICSLGHFLNSTVNECQPCPKGTYQDVEQRDTSCQSCPPNSTTSGLGSTSVGHCSNPCLINDKIELCPVNSQCEAPSVGSEDFSCVCWEGFKEALLPDGTSPNPNSPHCIDVCDEYCINGGKCDWKPGNIVKQYSINNLFN